MYIYLSHFYDKYVCKEFISVKNIYVCLSVCLSKGEMTSCSKLLN